MQLTSKAAFTASWGVYGAAVLAVLLVLVLVLPVVVLVVLLLLLPGLGEANATSRLPYWLKTMA